MGLKDVDVGKNEKIEVNRFGLHQGATDFFL